MNLEDKIKVGLALKECRKQKSISMRKLAAKMGYANSSYINQIEKGEFKDGTTPKKVCEALGLEFVENYSFEIRGL